MKQPHKKIRFAGRRLLSMAEQWRPFRRGVGYAFRVCKRRNSSKPRIAVYVAGDENIYFPGLVALASVEHYNRGTFDLFMATNVHSLDRNQLRTLRSYGITLIDISALEGARGIERLGDLPGDRDWPWQIHVNWFLPEHFYSMGYKYSLKLDYDTLITRPFKSDFWSFFNGDTMFSMLNTQVDPRLPAEVSDALATEMGLRPPHYALNCGVGFFNNELCDEHNFFRQYAGAYSILTRYEGSIRTPEQVALAIVGSNYLDLYSGIPNKFNHRVMLTPPIQSNRGGKASDRIVILHFLSPYKPWKELSDDDLRTIERRKIYSVIFSRDLWHSFARNIEGYESYVEGGSLQPEDWFRIDSILRFNRLEVASQKKGIQRARRANADQLMTLFGGRIAYGSFKGTRLEGAMTWGGALDCPYASWLI